MQYSYIFPASVSQAHLSAPAGIPTWFAQLSIIRRLEKRAAMLHGGSLWGVPTCNVPVLYSRLTRGFGNKPHVPDAVPDVVPNAGLHLASRVLRGFVSFVRHLENYQFLLCWFNAYKTRQLWVYIGQSNCSSRAHHAQVGRMALPCTYPEFRSTILLAIGSWQRCPAR